MSIKKFVIYFLEKESYSSYPEILTESTFVLWFACQICLQFGLRILPELGASRFDPDTDNYFHSLLKLSGLEVNDCFWDEVMSGWTPPHPITVARAEAFRQVVDVPAVSNQIIGYMAAFLTIILTTLLSGSLIYLVYINRHWTYPISKDHLPCCLQVEAFIQRHRPAAGKRHGPASILMIMLAAMAGAITFILYYASWMVCSAIPVVLLWLCVILTVSVCGPSAVFPGCILFASILAFYCTGRIWGLWMNESYLALMKKGIRKLVAAQSTERRPSINRSQENGIAGTDENKRQQHRKRAVCSLSAFFLGCIAVYFNAWPLFQQFPIVMQWQSETGSANWTYWHSFNATGTCTKHGTYFDQGTAMLSYWVDLQSEELRSKPRNWNTERLLSFTPSFSPAVGWTYLVWCGVLSAASGIPVMAVQYAEYIIVGIAVLVAGGLLGYRGVQACCNKWRRHVLDQRNLTADNRYRAQLLIVDVAAEEPGAPDNAPSDCFPAPTNIAKPTIDTVPCDRSHGDIISTQRIPEAKNSQVSPVSVKCGSKVVTVKLMKATKTTEPCVCEALSHMWSVAMNRHCPLVTGLVLPYSLVGLFVPECLQLPGLLLLLTVCTIWMYGNLVKCVWHMGCIKESVKKECKDRCVRWADGTVQPPNSPS
ncbi:uncharacterized protein LOC129582995 [Paramacrobiotus metropolitanus]|uniref:uncharacterized protein LOC129582995 n=1 Tax=Paramacrobiotus metropolitanus TaxID=2943436 RepID=UPI0024463891|nr:uncharacterized protein LOC129582995 [Paramacrobiotus metropolitanus]XP_055330617.1 uncharacterized protein LOC129582995 [Paramacrobiotus metropolitanus]XP_055330618.1 uncharacterized protein LOC129582995 [Paramacrobiotus metropolitanus]XP_055330619.1 uncharacterized protein LOC129582995 [Paramacrobiotus metropolitanus]XP_055330620.1 uncharacterized protein LOC129582995 [Paramacrobiotus metropolitanus]